MYKKYWDMMEDFKIAEYYYQFYSISAKRRKKVVSFICTIASAAFIYSWYSGGKAPLLWAILIFAAQVVSVLQPLFPYEAQYHAACYICQDITLLLVDVEADWNMFTEETPDSEYIERIKKYQKTYIDIENRFASSGTFPACKCIHNKAQASAKTYLKRYTR